MIRYLDEKWTLNQFIPCWKIEDSCFVYAIWLSIEAVSSLRFLMCKQFCFGSDFFSTARKDLGWSYCTHIAWKYAIQPGETRNGQKSIGQSQSYSSFRAEESSSILRAFYLTCHAFHFLILIRFRSRKIWTKKRIIKVFFFFCSFGLLLFASCGWIPASISGPCAGSSYPASQAADLPT